MGNRFTAANSKQNAQIMSRSRSAEARTKQLKKREITRSILKCQSWKQLKMHSLLLPKCARSRRTSDSNLCRTIGALHMHHLTAVTKINLVFFFFAIPFFFFFFHFCMHKYGAAAILSSNLSPVYGDIRMAAMHQWKATRSTCNGTSRSPIF